MMRPHSMLLLVLALSLIACDDTASSVEPAPDSGLDQGLPTTDSGQAPDGSLEPDAFVAEPDGAIPDAAPPPADIAWVEVSISPRFPLYSLGQTLRGTAVAYDAFGQVLDVQFKWEARPPEIATVAGSTFTTVGEGQGWAVACARNICGKAAFYVDAEPPRLIITEPDRGALLGGDQSRTIRVRGTATDTRGEVDVRVNGFRVTLGEGGTFSFDLPARFGVNAIRVTADDGARPAAEDQREVLWAPSWERVLPDRAIIGRAIALRLDQALLDGDVPLELPEGAGVVSTPALGIALEAMTGLIDASVLLDDPQLAEGEGLNLRIEDISFGEPDVQLSFTETGMDLFISLPEISIETSGVLAFEGIELSLNGRITVSLAAFATMDAQLVDGALGFEVSDVGLAMGQIVGEFESPTVGVLLTTVGSSLRRQILTLAEDLVDGLLRDQLPAMVSQGLDGLLGAFSEIPLELASGIEGVPPLSLIIRMAPSELTLIRNEQLLVGLAAEIIHPGPVVAPHEDPGLPSIGVVPEREAPGDGLAAIVDLDLINGLLHEIWRARLLQLEPALPPQAGVLLSAVRVDARMTPVVAPSPPGSPLPLEVQIGDMRLYATGRLAEEPDVYAMSISVGLSIQVIDGALQLVISESPDIDATLIQQPGANPVLSADAVAQLTETLVWPLVAESLAGGLSLPLEMVDVPVGAFQAYTPRLEAMRVTPVFEPEPIIDRGRLILEGALQIDLELSE